MLLSGIHDFRQLQTRFPPRSVAGMTELGVLQLALALTKITVTAMLLVDDILLFPFQGLMWIFREIQHAAEEEIAGEADGITTRLSELYMMLETGQMSEADFDAEEKKLLDRLEVIETQKNGTAGNGNDQDANEEDEEEYVTIDRKH